MEVLSVGFAAVIPALVRRRVHPATTTVSGNVRSTLIPAAGGDAARRFLTGAERQGARAPGASGDACPPQGIRDALGR
jgi:hypothetical protein